MHYILSNEKSGALEPGHIKEILEIFSLFRVEKRIFRVEKNSVLIKYIQSTAGIIVTVILLKICFLNCFSPMTFYQK